MENLTKKQREENVKDFLCDLYGWDKDTVDVEEVWENLYGVKTCYERYVFEIRWGKKNERIENK